MNCDCSFTMNIVETRSSELICDNQEKKRKNWIKVIQNFFPPFLTIVHRYVKKKKSHFLVDDFSPGHADCRGCWWFHTKFRKIFKPVLVNLAVSFFIKKNYQLFDLIIQKSWVKLCGEPTHLWKITESPFKRKNISCHFLVHTYNKTKCTYNFTDFY